MNVNRRIEDPLLFENANEPRPDGTTMEGMIWNANHVLEQALKPNVNGLPKKLFQESIGIVIITTVQVGFILSGAIGTGIVIKKMDGTPSGWSPPCAVGMSGIGFGILAGISAKDFVIFIMDEPTMDSLTTKHGMSLGAQYELTLGPIGRNLSAGFDFSKKGVGSAIAIGYTKGVFGGITLQGAAIGTRESANNTFYCKATNAKDILCEPGYVEISDFFEKSILLNELYDKLTKLQSGESSEPVPEEEDKKVAAKEEADKQAESIKDSPEVVHVDVEAEAAKEKEAAAK